jgi:hypothetical protein
VTSELTVPHSFCDQVLKVKYYPRGQLHDTVFSANASPSWQGVQHGLDLLKRGLLWHIGNGEILNLAGSLDTKTPLIQACLKTADVPSASCV